MLKSHDPNFIIVGAMKSSTSAAAINLNQHPNIFCVTPWWKNKVTTEHNIDTDSLVNGMSDMSNKELDFFNRVENYAKGIEFYRRYFPVGKRFRGEASPNYFHLEEKVNHGTIERMKSALMTDIKIIVLLRDPIDRAFSHWNHIQRPETSFGERFKGKTFNECTELMSHDGYKNALLNRSKYADNLQLYVDAFGKDNIYVGLQENIKDDMLGEYNKIFEFLGADPLDTDGIQEFREIHTGEYSVELDTPTREYLQFYFKESVDKLKELYPDLDYSKWDTY